MFRRGFGVLAIILVVAAILIIGGGGWYYLHRGNSASQTTPASSGTSTTTQTSALKTYTNTKWGIQFQYPSQYQIGYNEDNAATIGTTNASWDPGYDQIAFQVFPTDPESTLTTST